MHSIISKFDTNKFNIGYSNKLYLILFFLVHYKKLIKLQKLHLNK